MLYLYLPKLFRVFGRASSSTTRGSATTTQLLAIAAPGPLALLSSWILPRHAHAEAATADPAMELRYEEDFAQ
jgi:hypothetical protein